MRNVYAGFFVLVLLCPALCSASQGGSFPVNNYGADPSGVKDSTAAITEAIADAEKYTAQNPGQPAEVVFGAGQYKAMCSTLVGPGPNNLNFCFSVEADNLTITGQGAKKSKLVLENPMAGALAVNSSSSITISNFAIDYAQDALPFTQGTVVSIDPSSTPDPSFVLQIQDGFPSLNSTFFSQATQRWGVIVDPEQPIAKTNVTVSSQIWTESWDSVPGQPDQFKMYVRGNNGVGDLSVGDRFVQVARYAGSALSFSNSKDVAVQGMVFYAANVQAVSSFQGTGNLIINNNTVTTLPNSGRYHSINGGAFIVQNQRGAVSINKNSTQGGTDDSVNIYTNVMDVMSVSDSPPSVVTSDFEGVPIQVGDELQFVQTTTGQVLGTSTVTSVSSTKSNGFWYYTLGLSSAVAGVIPDPNGIPPAALNTYYTGTTVFDLSLAGTSTIQNNTFNNSLMGMNIRSCNLNCGISNNTFYLTSNGVNLEADFLQLQGPVPGNISIAGNKFFGGIINTAAAGPQPYAYQVLIGNFMATPTGPGGAHVKMMPSTYKGPENVNVSSNSFADSDAESILISGAQNISLKNSTISASGSQPRQDVGASVSVAEASGIRVSGLKVKDTRPQTHEALDIADTVPCGLYPSGISTSKVLFNGTPANAILDERNCGP